MPIVNSMAKERSKLILIILPLLIGCSHANKKTEAQPVGPDKTLSTPRPGDTYSSFLIGSPNFENDCEGYKNFYVSTLQKPIANEEKQAIAVWGDLYLCICREKVQRDHERLNDINTANQDTGCKLKPDREKYGVYMNLALRINERFNGGSVAPLVHYLQCARRRLQGELISNVALVSCLNAK
jgi:hypothetical protein